MTDPITDPDLVEHLDDATLLRAHDDLRESLDEPIAAVLIRELERRGLSR